MASTKRKGETARSGASAPISAHPAFPAIVALWFAALFGLGSMVLPAALVEIAVVRTGLDAILPELAAPLGIKGRMMIALAMTVAGAALGLFVARKVAASQQMVEPARKRRSVPTDILSRRPISAHDELGDDLEMIQAAETESPATFAPSPGVHPGRRRALSITEESGMTGLPRDIPLPGADFDDFPASPARQPTIPSPMISPSPVISPREPLELDAFAPIAPTGPVSEPEVTVDPVRPFMRPEPVAEQLPPVHPAPSFGGVPTFAGEAPRSLARPLAELGIVELVERLAAAMKSHKAGAVASHGTGQLGGAPGELANRASAALSRFPAAADGGAACAEAQETVGNGAQETERETAMAGSITRSPGNARDGEPPFPTIPAALRPLIFEEDDITEASIELPPFLRPRHEQARDHVPFPSPVAAFGPPLGDDAMEAAPEPEEEDDDDSLVDEDEGYSSLLNLSAGSAHAPKFVRIEEPEPEHGALEPVVVFPGHEVRRHASPPEPEAADAPPAARLFDAPGAEAASFAPPLGPAADPGETERALRVALANLQRISGAA